jgi:AcrR family transcriptional regulator
MHKWEFLCMIETIVQFWAIIATGLAIEQTGHMTATFAERARAQMREEVLDAATAAVGNGGWPALRMQAIADQVGVSRRTLYNEFGTKALLAEALVLRVTRRILDDVEAHLLAAPDLVSGWEASVLSALRTAQSDPVLLTVLTGSASGEFLPLLTTHGTPVIEYATAHMTDAAMRRWPELPVRQTTLAAEASVRLAISLIIRPGETIEGAARDVAELATGYLGRLVAT